MDKEGKGIDSKLLIAGFVGGVAGLILGAFIWGNKDGENLIILGSNENLPQDIKGALGAVYSKINNEGYVIKSIYLKNQNHGKDKIG